MIFHKHEKDTKGTVQKEKQCHSLPQLPVIQLTPARNTRMPDFHEQQHGLD